MVLLEWMPEYAWCSLGMLWTGADGVVQYRLFSPVLRKQLLKLEKLKPEKENQNEQ